MADREQQGVPLPDPSLHEGVVLTRAGRYRGTEDGYTTIQLLAYGNARAAEARREALEEAERKCRIWLLDKDFTEAEFDLVFAALLDKPQAEQGKESP